MVVDADNCCRLSSEEDASVMASCSSEIPKEAAVLDKDAIATPEA